MRPKAKYAVIHRHREEYPISVMCKFFGVSRSGYYDFTKRLGRPEKDADLAKTIQLCQDTTDKTYGYRRVWLWLKHKDIHRNPKTVLRIMKKYGLLSEIRRRRKWVNLGQQVHKYVEEIGTFNAFFVIGDEVITAPLDSGTILPGITRNSVIQLLSKWGIKVSERKLSIDEIVAASKNGTLKEIFASGTAAVISPIGWLNIKGEDMQVADGKVGTIAQRLYDKLYGMQTGVVEDDMGWTYPLGF